MESKKIRVDHLPEADQKSYADLFTKRQDGRDEYKVLMLEYKALQAGVEKVEKKFGITKEDHGEMGSVKHRFYNLAYNVRHKYHAIDHDIRMYKESQKNYTRQYNRQKDWYVRPSQYPGEAFGSLHRMLDETNGKITKARSHVRIANKYLTYLHDSVKYEEKHRQLQKLLATNNSIL